MTTVTTNTGTNTTPTAAATTAEATKGIGADFNMFLKLLTTQMQNQDPLNPMDNSQLLQQISQMREIAATGDMTNTLQAVLLGQNVSSGSALIGKQVSALTDAGDSVTGNVDKVNIAGKTGTAAQPGAAVTHGWFVGLAPAEKPEVAVVVYIEQGRGLDAAALAQPILRAYFEGRR